MEEADRYRCRHIYLKPSDDPALQAEAACAALANIDGILLAAAHSHSSVHIVYSLDALTLDIVIDLLAELDFELDSSFLISIRQTIYGYLEDNARDKLQLDTEAADKEEADVSDIPQQDNDQYWEDYH